MVVDKTVGGGLFPHAPLQVQVCDGCVCEIIERKEETNGDNMLVE